MHQLNLNKAIVFHHSIVDVTAKTSNSNAKLSSFLCNGAMTENVGGTSPESLLMLQKNGDERLIYPTLLI